MFWERLGNKDVRLVQGNKITVHQSWVIVRLQHILMYYLDVTFRWSTRMFVLRYFFIEFRSMQGNKDVRLVQDQWSIWTKMRIISEDYSTSISDVTFRWSNRWIDCSSISSYLMALQVFGGSRHYRKLEDGLRAPWLKTLPLELFSKAGSLSSSMPEWIKKMENIDVAAF